MIIDSSKSIDDEKIRFFVLAGLHHKLQHPSVEGGQEDQVGEKPKDEEGQGSLTTRRWFRLDNTMINTPCNVT